MSHLGAPTRAAEMRAFAAQMAVEDRSLLSGEETLDCFAAADEVEAVMKVNKVSYVRSAYLTDATAEVVGKTAFSWLVEDRRTPRPEASRLLLLAHHLPDYPPIREAFESRTLDFEQSVALVRGVLNTPGILRQGLTEWIVEHAVDATPKEIGELVNVYIEASGDESLADRKREHQLAQRRVSIAETMDGVRDLKGRLTEDVGAIVEEALRIAGLKVDEDDDRTAAQRAHDALGEIARSYLEQVGAQPSFSGSPIGVMVAVPLEVLEGRVNDESAMLLPSRAHIGPETARRLACDAQLIPMVLGTKGEVLDIGRAARDFTPAMRRAAYVEQGGNCAFPGCRRAVVECHHIEWWSNGGKTSLDNAAWLCAYHHWLVHEGKWSMRRSVDRSFTFTSPHGSERTRHLSAA